MSNKNILLSLLLLFVLTGCKIQIVVPAGGNVTTQSGNYGCDSGETCVVDVVDLFFKESFVAQPEPGYTFVQWKKQHRGLCRGRTGNCPINSSLAERHETFMAILESDTTYYLEPDFGRSDTWSRKADLPMDASAMATCAVRGKLYAMGIGAGHTLEGELPSAETRVEEYDPVTDTWTQKANMPTGRRWGSSSAVKDKCYVIGGLGASPGASTKVEEYDPATNTWRERSSLPTPRSAHASAAVDGKIYVVGGGAVGSWRHAGTAKVDIYNPAANQWSVGADIPTPRGGVVAGAIDGYIYVVGGSNTNMAYSDLVDRYHPATDTWKRMAKLPVKVDFATATVHDGKLYVIGGLDENNDDFVSAFDETTPAVYRYDPKANQWTRLSDMTQRRMAAGSEMVNGRILVIGGRDQRDCCGSLSVVEEYTP